MTIDRLPNPLLLARVGHPVAPDQHLLVIERETRDLPADREVLEQHLVAPSPDVLGRGGVLSGWSTELANGPRAERAAQPQDVALAIAVFDGLDRLAPAPRHVQRMATDGANSLAPSPIRSTSTISSGSRPSGSSRGSTATSREAPETNGPYAGMQRPSRGGSCDRACSSTSPTSRRARRFSTPRSTSRSWWHPSPSSCSPTRTESAAWRKPPRTPEPSCAYPA